MLESSYSLLEYDYASISSYVKKKKIIVISTDKSPKFLVFFSVKIRATDVKFINLSVLKIWRVKFQITNPICLVLSYSLWCWTLILRSTNLTNSNGWTLHVIDQKLCYTLLVTVSRVPISVLYFTHTHFSWVTLNFISQIYYSSNFIFCLSKTASIVAYFHNCKLIFVDIICFRISLVWSPIKPSLFYV